jgi:hypothetical protein
MFFSTSSGPCSRSRFAPRGRHAAQGQSLMGGGAEKGQSFAAGPPKHVRVLHDGKQQEERIDHGIVQGEAGREPRPKPRKGVAEDRGKPSSASPRMPRRPSLA